jgi:hypothetical protein
LTGADVVATTSTVRGGEVGDASESPDEHPVAATATATAPAGTNHRCHETATPQQAKPIYRPTHVTRSAESHLLDGQEHPTHIPLISTHPCPARGRRSSNLRKVNWWTNTDTQRAFR